MLLARVGESDVDDLQADLAFRALGHRDRRRLLRLIGVDEHPVGALAVAADLAQPIASQHLKVLRSAGLVTARVDGNRRLYSLDVTRVGELRSLLDQFWTERLGVLQHAAEQRQQNVTDSA